MKKLLLNIPILFISLFFAGESYAQLTATISSINTCFGSCSGTATVIAIGGTAPYIYVWGTGATTATVSGLCAGNYTAIVTDATSSTASASVTITQLPPPIATVSGDATICSGKSATLTASGGTNYIWSTGYTTSSIIVTPFITTTYSVTASIGPCSNMVAATVTVKQSPVTTTSVQTICAGYIATLTASGGGGVYFWSTAATGASIVVTPLVTTTYSVVSNNCMDSVTVIVNNSSASLTLLQDTVNALVWYAQPTITGTAPFTYSWDFGDGNTSTLPTPTHNYAVAGHYHICLTITDANGCSSSTCDSTYRMAAPGIIQSLVVVNALTGIIENPVSVNSVFPNPANDMLEVSLSQFTQGEISITDLMGREIYREKINASNVRVNVSNLQTGCYNLSIVSGEKIIHSKIMIAR